MWIAQVFLGLEHMHLRMSTLLRDLKPENVVLDEAGRAKLTDFGFGRFGVESTGRWSFGIPVGSPGYIAPEILRQEEYDFRVDLYSLGVLVWVLLTGGQSDNPEPKPPMGNMKHQTDFDAHFEDWQRLAQCIADPENNSAIRLPHEAADFISRLTQRRPDDRMDHAAIRQHSVMTKVQLPAYESPPEKVDAWLSSCDNAFSQSSAS
jgi:serine/threonine protein kinase